MDWISDPLDRLQWALWHFLATIFWAIDRLVLIGAVLIHTLRKWITNPGGIIDLVMSSMLQGEQALSLKTFMAGAILLALLLVAFVFILRPLIGQGHSPVDLRKVFLWLALAGYLFSTGGAIFTSMEEFRSQLSSSAYQIAASVNSSIGGAGGAGTTGATGAAGTSGSRGTTGNAPNNREASKLGPVAPSVQAPDGQEGKGLDSGHGPTVSQASGEASDGHTPALEGFAQLPSYVRVRTGASRDGTLGQALAEVVGGRGRDSSISATLPTQLANLPTATRAALQEMGQRGYGPDEVEAVAGAVNTVVSRLQLRNLPPAAITSYFLDKNGSLDIESQGVSETLKELGAFGPVWSGDLQRRGDLAQLVGANLQLEKTYHARDIREAVGHAVVQGGSADSAAEMLGVSPGAAWGGRYGSVQSVIARSPLFGLSSAESVQRFVGLAQQRPLDDLVVRQVSQARQGASELSPEQQALLDGVRARAAEVAAGETGDSSDAATEAVLRHYLRDVRNIPARITAPIAPVAPTVSVMPAAHGGPETAGSMGTLSTREGERE